MPDEREEKEEKEGLQMSFLDHLDELRRRLIHSVLAIAIAFSVCFAFSGYIYDFLAAPIKEQLRKQRRQKLAANVIANVDQLTDGSIVPFTFAEDTIINGVRIPAGTTTRIKVVTKDNKRLALTAE